MKKLFVISILGFFLYSCNESNPNTAKATDTTAISKSTSDTTKPIRPDVIQITRDDFNRMKAHFNGRSLKEIKEGKGFGIQAKHLLALANKLGPDDHVYMHLVSLKDKVDFDRYRIRYPGIADSTLKNRTIIVFKVVSADKSEVFYDAAGLCPPLSNCD